MSPLVLLRIISQYWWSLRNIKVILSQLGFNWMIFKREIRLKRNFLVCRADTLITMRNAVFFKSSDRTSKLGRALRAKWERRLGRCLRFISMRRFSFHGRRTGVFNVSLIKRETFPSRRIRRPTYREARGREKSRRQNLLKTRHRRHTFVCE